MWFVAPFSNSSTHRTDPVTLPLTTIQDTSTHTKSDASPVIYDITTSNSIYDCTSTSSAVYNATVYDGTTSDATASFIYNNTTLPTTSA